MCAALVGMSYFGQAQVGIGTKDPVKGSALEVQSTDKGVLLPRIPLASKTTLSPIDGNAADTKIKGLIVFNTNPNLDPADKGGSEGFYYWTGAAWTKLSSQDEIIKLIQENTSSSNEFIKEIVNIIVNEGSGSALKGTSVVLYDFDKKEFYTLVKDKDGNIVTSTPIDLGLKDVVRYKIVEGKTVLVYKDANGQEQTIDLNNLQIDTFLRDAKDKSGKVTGYIYFSENKIAEWIKANPKDAHRYKTDMPDTDGKLLDIVGDVANNLQEIFNSKKEIFETFVTQIKGNVTVRVEGDRTYLVYNDGTKEVKIDLSQLETETFIRTIENDVDGKKVITGYVHFNESQISKWIKANPGLANDYKTQMKNTDGTYLDIIGAVTHNFKEIINNNKDLFQTIINESKGNVTIKVVDGKTVLVYKDENGKEVILDLSAMEVVTFVRPILNDKKVTTGYVYFNEQAIAKWLKDNPSLAAIYQREMPDAAGVKLDIVGDISNNFEEIINKEGNKELITNVINNSKGNVTVKVDGNGKVVLVYKDDKGNEQIIDLSSQEVDTFIKEIIDETSKKVTGYVYFGEEAITKWQKANPDLAKRYKEFMKLTDGGQVIDVVGSVSNSFKEIINKEGNKELITNVINSSKGNVTVKVDENGKVVLVYIDENGKEQLFDLSSQEVDTFIMTNKDPKTDKIVNYIYFGEAAIVKWQKANPKLADEYRKYMKADDVGGEIIDVVGAVSQNFEEIINQGDNISYITQAKGNVTVKVEGDKTFLVYKDDKGVEQKVDLSANETETYIKEVKDSKNKVTGYVYFSEEAITKWRKDPANKGKDYKKDMLPADGTSIDVVGAVSQSFEEIINQGDNISYITQAKGNVTVKVEGDKTFLVYKDDKGVEQKVDLSSNETLTFIRDVKKKQIINNVETEKVVGYVYFSEEAIAIWKKANAGLVDVNKYKDLMKDTDGKVIDVIGAVSQNFGDIINQGDNISYITQAKGNVTVKVEGDKTFLVYKDDKGVEQKVDLSSNETLTFIRDVKKKQIINNVETEKVVGYVYFSEEAIAIWKKANAGLVDVNKYKDLMKDTDGKVIDVVGAVSQNFGDIINQGDNISYITQAKGNVTIKVEGDKTYLVYRDDKGVEQKVDLSSNETVTFVRPVVVDGKTKGYLYFNEDVVAKWIKANAGKDPIVDMPDGLGKLLDVVGDVSSNLEEIINNNQTAFNKVLNEYLTQGGTVYYGKIDDKPESKDVLYSIVKDVNGKETKTVIDLSNTIREILKDTNNELITELKKAVNYDITEDISETNIKFGGSVVSVFSKAVKFDANDSEAQPISMPRDLYGVDINVYDIKLYTSDNKLVTVGITDIKVDDNKLYFTLGNGDIYTPIAAGTYKAVIQFTK